MDKLSMAIVLMEAHFACINERLCQAWDTIHAELVEGQKPTTNSKSMPCEGCESIGECRERWSEGHHPPCYKG
jgi:hypothetical protein